MRVAFALAATLAVTLSNLAVAQGALDFADPCVSAEKTYATSADALRGRSDAILAEWDRKAEPPGEMRSLYVEAVRTAAFKAWSEDATVKPMLEMLGKQPNFDAHRFFLESIYPKAVTQESEADLIRKLWRVDYDTKLKGQLLADREKLDTTLTEQRSELDKSCSKDVVSQVFRATVLRSLLIVGDNFAAAKDERGVIAQALRATSGISITDIQEHGILGGPGSELNKALNAAGVGENSELRKSFDALLKISNPLTWKVEIKLPDLPNLPNLPSPKPLKIGDVCIPWC